MFIVTEYAALSICCITYLALTQLFPVLVTGRFPIVKYTHCGAFSAFHLGVCHFFFSHGCVHMRHMDSISSIFARFFSSKYFGIISLTTRYRCIG